MNLPPTDSAHPFVQLYQWIAHPIDYITRNANRYGEQFCARLGNLNKFYFLSNPADIERVFTANPDEFDAGRANWILRPTVGDYSLLLLDGALHKRHRQLLMPPFHGERMKAYGQTICEITKQVVNQWQVGQPFVTRSAIQEISLNVILQAVFGLYEGDRFVRLRQLIDDFLQFTTSRLGFTMAFFPLLQRDYGAWSPGGKFLRMLKQIDDELYAEIQERRSHPDEERTDILSLLLSARDEDGQPMTDVEIRDELITLLIAGHETTATAITWALYWMHLLPEVKTKLLAELATLGDNPDFAAITRLPYLNAVCSETLRIYPVVVITFLRITKNTFQVGDYTYPPESTLAPCIYLVHRRADVYPEPEKFKPERFLERQFSPYEFFPFGGSNRRCIGAAFALYEMKLVLATILKHCELKLLETQPVVPIRRGVTLAPKGGVKMLLINKISTSSIDSHHSPGSPS